MGTGFLLLSALAVLGTELLVLAVLRHPARLAGWLRRPAAPVVLFLGVQLLMALLVMTGGRLEQRQRLYSALVAPVAARLQSPQAAPLHIAGDAALVNWVQGARPELPRPDFGDPQSVRSWQDALRTRLAAVFQLGGPRQATRTSYQVIQTAAAAPDVTRTLLTFVSFDGTTIPAYLFVPEHRGRGPAVVVLSGHVAPNENGIRQLAGLEDSYQHGAALALAKAGFVTITPEFRGFGDLGSSVGTEHKLVAFNAILGGSFYKSFLARDLRAAVDLLRSLPSVDPERIGMTGASFGGEMAVTYAALDPTIKVVVFQAYGGQLGAEAAAVGADTEQPHYCHTIPGANRLLLQEDLFHLLAPRPTLGIEGDQDFRSDGRLFADTVGRTFATLGAPAGFAFELQHGGHEYFVDPAVQFFQHHL